MNTPQTLLTRLDEIGQSLAQTGNALALLGLGSVGQELDRLDQYSDLDFFAIVQPGHKPSFIDDLIWLSRIQPLAYVFQNTADGYKLLFADGIFCEFAIFEPDELAQIPFAPGRIIWQAADFAVDLLQRPAAGPLPHRREWLLGEALTNLYVGLGRYHRGEKLSAARFIQGHAVDRLLELATEIEPMQIQYTDPFDKGRRFEQRFPQSARHLAQWLPGYDDSPAAARSILAFLDEHFTVNPAMKRAILAMCPPPGD